MNQYVRVIFLAVIGSLFALGPSVSQAGPFFQGLGFLPGGGMSRANDVSADGSTVVGVAGNLQGNQAFRWTASGGMQGLGDLPGGLFYSTANAVSRDGSVVVGTGYTGSLPSSRRAFRWTASGGMQELSGFSGTSYSGDTGVAVSGDGQAVVVQRFGNYVTSSSKRWDAPFLWTEGGATRILSFVDRQAMAISDDKSTVVSQGYIYDPSTVPPSLVFQGVYQSLDLTKPPSNWLQSTNIIGSSSDRYSVPFGVSDDGSVVVGHTPRFSGSFRWTASGGMQGLGDIPGGSLGGTALDVSGDGSIIVGESKLFYSPNQSLDSFGAFIWDALNGMRLLEDVLTTDYGFNLMGWHLSKATGISSDGLVITGYGINPNGQTEAWIANLRTGGVGGGGPAQVPEPMTLALFGVGLAGLAFLRRRRAA